tara:strand:+ start:906 stop:1118 length:213 start_codon:yes stop_codon:yes gene_type:complete
MALKDWKKEINSSFELMFSNRKTTGRITMLRHTKGWDLFIWGKGQSAIIRKNNLTKTKALSFAKSYMRKH